MADERTFSSKGKPGMAGKEDKIELKSSSLQMVTTQERTRKRKEKDVSKRSQANLDNYSLTLQLIDTGYKSIMLWGNPMPKLILQSWPPGYETRSSPSSQKTRALGQRKLWDLCLLATCQGRLPPLGTCCPASCLSIFCWRIRV